MTTELLPNASPWERRFQRERRARKEAERLLQAKSQELYDANRHLKVLLRTLEQRVEERTAEAELARQKAETASLAKTRFLATMSHEIRTPMNGVVGMADYLATTDLNADQHSSIRTLQAASATLRQLLDDLLDISKLESGRFELSTIAFSPQAFVEDMVALHQPTAKRRGLELTLEVQRTLPNRLIGDRMRIGQIIGNLLNNAIKFTEEGSVRLVVAAEGPTLTLHVIDTGIGIPVEARAKLFQRFAQADSSTSRVYGGSGLGLAICQELVRLMRGTIRLGSGQTHGTCVTTTLPLESVEPCDSGGPRTSSSDGPVFQDKGSLSGLRLLVIDDNGINRTVAERLLKWLGCTVELRCSGPSGVKAAQESRFDAVLMDLHMPVMDGFEATQKLWEHQDKEQEPHTPVFALTADAMEGVEARCLAHGMEGVIPKPVTRGVLSRYLRHLLNTDAQ